MNDENIVKKTCKELGISYDAVVTDGSNMLLNTFIEFENSKSLKKSHGLLIGVDYLINIFEIAKINNQHIFVMPLHDRQEKLQHKIYYPNIANEIKSALYVLEKWNLLEFSAKDTFCKQTDFIKNFKLDKNMFSIGIYFLSKYGFIDKIKIKNRVHFKIKKEK